jgi:hypothetical protein
LNLYQLLWGFTAPNVSVFVLCLHSISETVCQKLCCCNIWMCFFEFIPASLRFHSTKCFCFCTLSPLNFRDSASKTVLLLIYGIHRMSEMFWYSFRTQWRELNDTWLDDRYGGVGSSDNKWAVQFPPRHCTAMPCLHTRFRILYSYVVSDGQNSFFALINLT